MEELGWKKNEFALENIELEAGIGVYFGTWNMNLKKTWL